MKSNDFMGRGGATERGDLWDILSRREHSEVCADESHTIAARLGGYLFRAPAKSKILWEKEP